MKQLNLHEHRHFDPDPSVRKIAVALYEETRDLPLVCPHGHVDARMLAENEPFPEPASLILKPDHYIFRMLYSQGIPLEAVGISRKDGVPVEKDPRKTWQIFADHYYLFAGTPTRAWLDQEFHDVFGVRVKLESDSAQYIYDQINECLQSPEFLPRALFERFNIEVLSTTDAAEDALEYHQQILADEWKGKVIPTFRPDNIFRIADSTWPDHFKDFERVSGVRIADFDDFLKAIRKRRRFFKSLGGVATDHAVLDPCTHRLSEHETQRLFQKALSAEATRQDQAAFQAHMLMEMARMSVEDGLVMQVHAGAFYNHNDHLAYVFGKDMGGDIPVRTEFTLNLRELLSAYGNNPALTVIVFTLDESTYSRELAPMAGHYPALRLGPAWWFFDSMEGMRRYRELTTETAGIYNTAGFNDDTRAFCSIPARHDLSRRVDANYLAGLVARHLIDLEEARRLARAMAYDLARESYRLVPRKEALPVDGVA